MPPESANASARRRKLFMEAAFVGLTRDERIELSRVILHRDITSWKTLDEAQVLRMLDVFEGYSKIGWLLLNR